MHAGLVPGAAVPDERPDRGYGRSVHLENLVVDAVDPADWAGSGRPRSASERLTDEPEGFETRLTVEGGPVVDLCFQRVPEPPVQSRSDSTSTSRGTGEQPEDR